MIISIEIKKHCVELVEQGMTPRQIYDEYFKTTHKGQSFESFRRSLRKWKKKTFADNYTLDAGTYNDFIAHDATVQINGQGEIIQAWIKQKAEYERQFEQVIEAIKENTKVEYEKTTKFFAYHTMLEISLYDMHFPFSEYKEVQDELIELIQKQNWEEINIIVGQDLFHNDDFQGRTVSGRQIEKVDMKAAWNYAKSFWFNVIKQCLCCSTKVNLIYSKGNHDESFAWAFVQMLKIAFPDLNVNDSMKQRKLIYWDGCFIGITHGSQTKSLNNDLRGQFTIQFPQQFAKSKVREIHCGHLHHEKEADLYGVMIRRLSSDVPADEWSDNEGYVGSHKRFMVFEWRSNKLHSIYYLGG